MKFIQEVLQDFRRRQNLDIYITFVIAIIVAILGVVGVADQTVITSATLATLAVALVSLLQNRRDNDNISEAIDKIAKPELSAAQFFEQQFNPQDLRDSIIHSRKIYFWSTTFSTTLRTLRYAIEQALLAEAEIRILVLKPGASSEREPFRDTGGIGKERTDASVRYALMNLAEIAKSTATKKLEIRVIDYIPPWAIISIDPHLPTGYMRIRLNAIHIPGKTRPAFGLSKKIDKEWFDYFNHQFEMVWRLSEPIDVQKLVSD